MEKQKWYQSKKAIFTLIGVLLIVLETFLPADTWTEVSKHIGGGASIALLLMSYLKAQGKVDEQKLKDAKTGNDLIEAANIDNEVANVM